VTVVAVAVEADLATGGDEFFDGTEVGAEFSVVNGTQSALFELGTESERQLFLERIGEVERFDFPAEIAAEFIAELDAHASAVDAATFDGWQAQEAIDDVFSDVDALVSEWVFMLFRLFGFAIFVLTMYRSTEGVTSVTRGDSFEKKVKKSRGGDLRANG
jgi:hypothetical protein